MILIRGYRALPILIDSRSLSCPSPSRDGGYQGTKGSLQVNNLKNIDREKEIA
ncbi:MAG: hypothetical protein QME51_06410 [Planctomycetota bacterium]|nr:hypothetical protein [Planctomycetota bacterium]MDI6787986.1 hypothetical protein [Planctomycetota bacterium]